MVSLRYFILCNLATMDQRERLSCQGFFDSWDVSKLPAKVDPFYIVLGIDGLKTGEKASLTLSLKGPSGEYIWENNKLDVKSKDDNSPVVYILQLHQFPVNDIGVHLFQVSYKNKIIGKHPLKINEKGGDNK
jgi:hypothetical protein